MKNGFVVGLLALASFGFGAPLTAQEMAGMDDHENHEWRHTGAFYTRRAPDGCTLCGASLDLNGGYYFVPRDGAVNTQGDFSVRIFKPDFPSRSSRYLQICCGYRKPERRPRCPL